jgi:hypothetical protein
MVEVRARGTLLLIWEVLGNSSNDRASRARFPHRETYRVPIRAASKELDRGTINLELTVEWQEVKAVLVNTLASYPEAQQAVFSALEEAPNGN